MPSSRLALPAFGFPGIAGFPGQKLWRHAGSSIAVRQRLSDQAVLDGKAGLPIEQCAGTKTGRSGLTATLTGSCKNDLLAQFPGDLTSYSLNKFFDPRPGSTYLRATAQLGWSSQRAAQPDQGPSLRAGGQGEEDAQLRDLALPEHLAEQADEILKSATISIPRHRPGRQGTRAGRPPDRRSLQAFILELGYGFCFIGRQYRLAIGRKEYFVDLLFYHRFLKAPRRLRAQDRPASSPSTPGKMDFYLNLLNEKERAPDDAPSDRHHPLCGKGRRGGRVRAQDQARTASASPNTELQPTAPGRAQGPAPQRQAARRGRPRQSCHRRK